MSTQIHPPLDESIVAMNPNGQQPPTGGLQAPTGAPAPGAATPGGSTAQDRLDAAPPADRAMLDAMVHMSLRLRLRGRNLELATGLVGRELDLIALLTASGPTSVKSLVADLGLPRSTMTAIVDRLQDRHLVIRHPNPQDRRSVVLEATPAAAEALSRYQAGLLSIVEHAKKVLSEDEQAEFTRLLSKMGDTF